MMNSGMSAADVAVLRMVMALVEMDGDGFGFS